MNVFGRNEYYKIWEPNSVKFYLSLGARYYINIQKKTEMVGNHFIATDATFLVLHIPRYI
jgi:hypothetical protein